MDRNGAVWVKITAFFSSLSARRAWIEIAQGWRISGCALVALRKESVDRNAIDANRIRPAHGSLSARRAWIEM